jgi:hypothetical protein
VLITEAESGDFGLGSGDDVYRIRQSKYRVDDERITGWPRLRVSVL